MLSMIAGWKGSVEVDEQLYDSFDAFMQSGKQFEDSWHIKLLPKSAKPVAVAEASKKSERVEENDGPVYRITVKPYMTRPTEPGSTFDFMEKWNNNKPMPLRTMQGTVLKETRGMLKMKLHGVGLAEIYCMRCGRKLTHPVSRHYGIGPECMSKLGIVANIEAIDEIREKLKKVEWEGWVIKSAITEREEV